MAAIGWYGPLIDLAKAESHLLDDFVQLIVFVYGSQPIQKHNAANRGSLLKTNIQVGDDTRSSFSVSLWQKHIGAKIIAGDVLLLQNVKIVKFRDVLEAATVQITSVHILLHSYELIDLKGTDRLLEKCHIGSSARDKLRRVVTWVRNTESAHQHIPHELGSVVGYTGKLQEMKNWKIDDGQKLHSCLSVSEVSCLTTSCNAKFNACINELFLLSTFGPGEILKDQLCAGKKLSMVADRNMVDDLICTGCKLCGSPLDSSSLLGKNKFPLYCQKSSKYLHDVCLIYKPFLLNVADQGGQISLVVKNIAAEILFGNITAEKVRKCYQEFNKINVCCRDNSHGLDHPNMPHSSPCTSSRCAERVGGNKQPKCAMQIEGLGSSRKVDYYHIWLILLKILLQKGKNSPFQIEIAVDTEKDLDDGKFELLSLTAPCYNLDTYTLSNLPAM